jgi:hypothetical protein
VQVRGSSLVPIAEQTGDLRPELLRVAHVGKIDAATGQLGELPREVRTVVAGVTDEKHVDRSTEGARRVERRVTVIRLAVGDEDQMRRALRLAEADRATIFVLPCGSEMYSSLRRTPLLNSATGTGCDSRMVFTTIRSASMRRSPTQVR